MIKCRLSELANVLDCVMPEVDVTVESIVSDSRKVHYGALFAALPGSQVDGHDYAESAARMGWMGQHTTYSVTSIPAR